MGSTVRFQQILGVRFLVGSADDAIDQISRDGGLMVVPAAPALMNLSRDRQYREALLGADFAIADSALMVSVWNLAQVDRIPKVSGLKYLRALIKRPELRATGATFWVMPTAASIERNVKWLRERGIGVDRDHTYLAPMYGEGIEDEALLRQIEQRRPRHIIVGLGGGTQERLGLYLKRNLSYKPAIHCIGAAIAFLTGDQVRIPIWVDHAGLGWLWRTASNPAVFAPRYWGARHLASMILRYRDHIPLPPAHPVPLRAGLPPAQFER
jgi:N-acetylglucosaminyldiphosphoundecaprenol N-acetyl-beta-D-mannosaminyltransferase